MQTFLIPIGCHNCHGLGVMGYEGVYSYTCPECLGEGTRIVDLAREVGEDPSAFLNLYGSRRGEFLVEQGEHVTAYVVEHGWTWWDVGETAPAWMELPEGPSRLDFERESTERQGPSLAKAWPAAVHVGNVRRAG